jgi:uridine kinase
MTPTTTARLSDPAVPAAWARLPSQIAAAPPRCGPIRVVAVDGGAAAGKSGLAGWLAGQLPGSAVLALDDLLAGWSGQFDYADRLHRDILQPLSRCSPAGYRRYDWTAGEFDGWVPVPVPAGRILVVEGVSAIHGCAGTVSVPIFLDVPRAERERRWIERDGPLQRSWVDWLDAEDRFFAEHRPPPGTVVLHG